MALALYRKYRPRTFAEVIGQEHVTEPLSQALRSGRLHHAYLFSGPRGCGKTSSARILARSLNCDQGPTPEPCGVCASCRSLANDGTGSIDVIEIDAASHGGVDDARELREKAFFAPATSRYKIYVIDEAHMVSSAGFNALLKLVEEPPEYVKFIFATTEPEKVLGTIRSRTHHYPFRLIPPAVLRPYLQQLTEAEGIPVEPAVFPLVVRAGGGSARDTLSVLDQLIAGAGPEGVGYARAVALLGVTDVALIDEMCDALAAGDGAAAYATIDRVAEAGHDPRRFASDLLERLRDLIVLQQVPDAVAKGLIDGPADQLEAMSAQATRLGPATLSRCADIVHNGLVEMRGTTAPRLLLELITARMLLPGAEDSTGALLQRLERMERRLTLGDTHSVRGDEASQALDPPAPSPAPGPLSAASSPLSAASDSLPAAPGPAAGGPAGEGRSAARAAAVAAARRSGSGPSSDAAPSPTPSGVTEERAAHERVAHERVAHERVVQEGVAQEGVVQEGVVQGVSGQPGAALAAAGGDPSPTGPASAGAVAPSVPPAASTVPGPQTADAVDELPYDDEPPWDEDEPDTVAHRPQPAPAQRREPPAQRPEPSGLLPDAPEESAAAAVSPAPGQLTAAAVREVWPEIITTIGRQSKKVSALAAGATVRDLDGDTVVLTFRYPAHARMVAPEAPLIAGALYEALGGHWQVRCEVAGEAGAVEPVPSAQDGPARGARGAVSDSTSEPGRGSVRDSGRDSARGEPARTGGGRAPQPAGTPQATPRAPHTRRREPEASASGGDDDWPEPARPGELPPPGPDPASEDDDWPEVRRIGLAAAPIQDPPASTGVSTADRATTAVRDSVPASLRESVPASPSDSVPASLRESVPASPGEPADPPELPAPATRPTTVDIDGSETGGAGALPDGISEEPFGSAPPASNAWSAGFPAQSGAGAAGGAVPRAGTGIAESSVIRNAPMPAAPRPGADAAPGSARAAARAAARNAAARQAAKPAASPAWSDGSPAEEAPYDPEYDGPPAGGMAREYEGFDPGDEPLDDVIDEKTARESSEQQAMRLLQDAFGAEKIGEV